MGREERHPDNERQGERRQEKHPEPPRPQPPGVARADVVVSLWSTVNDSERNVGENLHYEQSFSIGLTVFLYV